MGRRQKMHAQQRRKHNRNRLLAILAITVVAVIVALFLILPGLRLSDARSILPYDDISNAIEASLSGG